LRRPKANSAKVLIVKFSASANAECVNSPTSIDEAQAYCEKFLKLADAALHTPQIMKKAS
jgi:hypothetical protein